MRKLVLLASSLVVLNSFYLVGSGYSLVWAAAVPILKVEEPLDGQVIEAYIVTLKYSLKSFTLKDYKQDLRNNPNQGHLLLWLDKDEKTVETAIKTFRPDSYAFADVLPGKHTLVVELVGNDHSSFDPQIIQTIKFETKAPPGSEVAPVKAGDNPQVAVSETGGVPPAVTSGGFNFFGNYFVLSLAAFAAGLLGVFILRR